MKKLRTYSAVILMMCIMAIQQNTVLAEEASSGILEVAEIHSIEYEDVVTENYSIVEEHGEEQFLIEEINETETIMDVGLGDAEEETGSIYEDSASDDIVILEIEEVEQIYETEVSAEVVQGNATEEIIETEQEYETETIGPTIELAAGNSISSATSISLGSTRSGSITSTNTADFYKFTLGSSGKVALSATSYISSTLIRVYDSNGKRLWYDYYSVNSSGQSAISEVFDLTKGTYYFEITRSSGTGNYIFNLSFTSAGESFTETANGINNTIANADNISAGVVYNGQIALNDEKDFYRFSFDSSGRVVFSSTLYTSNIYIRLYDSNGKRLWYDYYSKSSSGQCDVSEVFDLTKGVYYFEIAQSSSTGNYTFNLSFTGASESFTETANGINNTIVNANNIYADVTYNGQIALNDEKDFYRFSLDSSGRIIFSGTLYISNIYIRLYDSNGERLWYDYYSKSSSGQCDVSEVFDLTKGTYYLEIARSSGTGNYFVGLSFAGAGESFIEIEDGINNTIANANNISVSSTYFGQIAMNDGKDFYKFTVYNDGIYSLTASARIPSTYFRVYDSTGTRLVNQYSSSGSSGNMSLDKKIELSKGIYYLGIEKSSGTGNYSFSIVPHAHQYTSKVTRATMYSNGAISYKCDCGHETKSTIYYPQTIYLSSAEYTYDGKVKTPSVVVLGSDGRQIPSSNYYVSYAAGRKKVGRYTVTVTFTGNYSGSTSKTFYIYPASAKLSKVKAKSKGFTVLWKRDKQVTGYQIQYSLKKNFSKSTTKTISKNKTTSTTISRLRGKKKYYVRIRTYKKVSGTSYYSNWSAAKTIKTKK